MISRVATNKEFGGWLALFSRALQFYLTFGHIHAKDIYGSPEITPPAGVSIALLAGEALRAVSANRAFGEAGEATALLASSLAPAIPLLAPRSNLSRPVDLVATIKAVIGRRTLFQSRAPPAA